jgi:hypothetical protein
MSLPTYLQPCPTCGKLPLFSYTDTTVAVCTSCKTVYRLKEGGLLIKKLYPVIQAINDVISIGTTGTWQRKEFIVLGRFQTRVSEAVINYWTISLEDGALQYLVEGYGLYAIHTQIQEKRIITIDPNALTVGKSQKGTDEKTYQMEKRDECYKWEIEGESVLPDCDNRFPIYNFSSADGQHIEIIRFLEDYLISYSVTYTSFEELQLNNLQSNTPPIKEIQCENCREHIHITAYPYSHSLVCKKCKAYYLLHQNGEYKLQKKHNEIDFTSDIEIGTSGEIKGIYYTVIGLAIKQEMADGQSRWREYTLYNRQEGYAFLSEYAGHWTYVRQRGDTPVISVGSVQEISYQGEPFKLYNQYSFSLIFAMGEFPNNIFNDSKKVVKEFISPPEMWIREKSANEGIEWFLGQHISGSELKAAFGNKINLPYKSGIGAIEPTYYINPGKIFFVSLLLIGLLTLVHLITSGMNKEKTLLENTYSFPDSVANFSTVAGPVKLDKWRSSIEAQISARVDNNWFELDLSLVNTKTGEEFNLNEGVEYYHGYSDGESWTEGSNSKIAYLTSIPAGEYRIQINGLRDMDNMPINRVSDFSLVLTYDVPNHRNLFICIGLLLIWPFINFIIVNNNEKRRWMNSPFTPQTNEN